MLVKDTGKEGAVRAILCNDKYAGRMVYNRTSQKLHAAHVTHNKRADWAVGESSFEAIINPAIFDGAQEILELGRRIDNHAVLEPNILAQTVHWIKPFYINWAIRWVKANIHIRKLGAKFSLYTKTFISPSQFWEVTAEAHVNEKYSLLIRRIFPPLFAVAK